MKYDPNSMINITDADSFPRSPINEIVADRNNNLWLASNTKGLIQIANDKIKKTITIDDGLRTNNHRLTIRIVAGRVWRGGKGEKFQSWFS